MSTTLLDSSYRDSAGLQPLWSDNVGSVLFYDASSETWDRSGGGTASWFLERTLPNDLFYSELDSEKWSLSGTATTKAVSINDKASFSITSSEGSVYLTSDGLWSLTGDFNIRLGIVLDDYYDEYRSSVCFGLRADFGDGYNLKAAVARGYEADGFEFQALFTEGANPLYFGWSQLAISVISPSAKYVSLVRVGNTVTCYVGSSPLGSVTGSVWASDVVVSIGSEVSQINTFTMSASYFTVVSGQLAVPTVFDSIFRGASQAFPERSFLVLDDYGMSIMDYSDLSLWARFRVGDFRALTSISSKLAAINGRVYCVNETGMFVFDFIDDVVAKHSDGMLRESDVGLGLRNSGLVFTPIAATTPLVSDQVVDVSVKNLDGSEYIALATTSGINVVIDRVVVRENTEGSPPATAVHFSDNNALYWASFDSNNSGDLSYYNNIGLLATTTGTVFSRSGYYDSSTTPYALNSEHIYSIHTAGANSDQIALGTDSGLSVLLFPPDSFSPAGVLERSSDWSTSGTYSLKITPGNEGRVTLPQDSYTGVFQRVNLTGVSQLYFDARFVGPTVTAVGVVSYEIVVGTQVIKTYIEPLEDEDKTLLAETIDVSSFTGTHSFIIRLRMESALLSSADRSAYFDNFRTFSGSYQFSQLGGADPLVGETFITFTDEAKKVVYSTSQGYGSVDLDDNTSDFYTSASGVVSGMVINSAEFVAY